MLSARDLGANFFPSIQSSVLRLSNGYDLELTTDRPFGVGSLAPGELEVGLGRKNRFDDDKGLPEGVTEHDILSLSFTLSFHPPMNKLNSPFFQFFTATIS